MSRSKFCYGCSEELPIGEFGPSRGRSDGLQSRCRPCKRVYDKNWTANLSVEKRKFRNKQKQILQRSKLQFIVDYLRVHPCVDCGESDPVVLEFDHCRGIKLFEISQGTRRSLSSLKAEIKKCKVRCANCHRRKTAKQQKWYSGIT